MKKPPAISIITPVWNGLPYIKECVESVLKQDFTDWEMIISDNGSTDGTQAYLDEIEDTRIIVFKQKENLGIFGNLNFLFSKVNAPVAQILCADDYFIDNTAISILTTYWKQASDSTGMARFNYEEVAIAGNNLQLSVTPRLVSPNESDVLFFTFGNIAGNLSNMSIRTHVVAELSGFRPDLPYAGDYEFWSRASRMYAMGVERKFIIHVRRHAAVASNYLNTKGELIAQKAIIITDLYNRMIKRYTGHKFALQLHSTLCHDTLQRDTAVKFLLHGKTKYLKELEYVSSQSVYTLNRITRWALYILSGGGRIGLDQSAKNIIGCIKKYQINN